MSGQVETTTLTHGQTFADRHGGWSVMDMVDAADNIITVGGTVAATILSGGTASPLLVGAINRIGLKQAARMSAKLATKAISRGIRATPKMLRPVVKGAVKLVRAEVKSGLSKGVKTKILKAEQTAEEIYDYGSDAYEIYKFFFTTDEDGRIADYEPVEICPKISVEE